MTQINDCGPMGAEGSLIVGPSTEFYDEMEI